MFVLRVLGKVPNYATKKFKCKTIESTKTRITDEGV